MKTFNRAEFKEKALKVIVTLLYPLMWLFAQIGLLNTKKRQIAASILCAVFILTMLPFGSLSANAVSDKWDGSAAEHFSQGGDGTRENPYKISTASELKLFANIVNGNGQTMNLSACAILTQDIVLNVGNLNDYDGISENDWVTWDPMGTMDNGFIGCFDGNGHVISGIYQNNYAYRSGLFWYLFDGGVVSNLGIVNSYIRTDDGMAGGIGAVSCYCLIKNCYNEGTIIGKAYVGGICGLNYDVMLNCYNAGKVSGDEAIGGVCGENMGPITGCYNTGTVTGKSMVGGVTGYDYLINGVRSNCYNIGAVSGQENVGGVWGFKTDQITLTDCYYLEDCVKSNNGNDYCTPMSEAQMKSSDFVTALNGENDYYVFNYGIYPILSWQIPWDGSAAVEFSGGGVGTSAEPYKIATAGELKLFANIVNGDGQTQNNAAHAELTADIIMNLGDLSGYDSIQPNSWEEWAPIGDYNGVFDGKGHTIDGIYINTDQDNVGLFGVMQADSSISNLKIDNSYIYGKNNVGGVCAVNNGIINACFNGGKITGNEYTGGLSGKNYSTISECYSSGDVKGELYTGGISGCNFASDCSITGCYNSGTVKGKSIVGGVSGANYESDCNISECYNSGIVEGESLIGGVCGKNEGNIEACYYLEGTASGAVDGNDLPSTAESKTDTEMKHGNFVSDVNNGGNYFMFSQTGGYPILTWQFEWTINEDGTAIRTEIKPDGSVEVTKKDSSGNITETTVTNSDGSSIKTENKPDGSVIVTKKDSLGNTTEITITNSDGSTVKTVNKPDGSVEVTKKDSSGNTTEITITNPDGSTVKTVNKPDGSVEVTKKDSSGNITETTVTNADGSSIKTENKPDGSVIVTKKDSLGNTTEITITNSDGSTVKTVNKPDGSVIVTKKDSSGNTTETTVTNADGSLIKTENKPDGSVIVTKKDSSGNTTEITITNSDGSTVKTVNKPDGSVIVTKKDSSGNITETTVTNADGSSTKTENKPDGSVEVTKKDSAGNITEQTTIKADRSKTVVTYHADGTVSKKEYDPDGNEVSDPHHDTPETGDSNIELWFALLLVSGGALMLLGTTKKRNYATDKLK